MSDALVKVVWLVFKPQEVAEVQPAISNSFRPAVKAAGVSADRQLLKSLFKMAPWQISAWRKEARRDCPNTYVLSVD